MNSELLVGSLFVAMPLFILYWIAIRKHLHRWLFGDEETWGEICFERYLSDVLVIFLAYLGSSIFLFNIKFITATFGGVFNILAVLFVAYALFGRKLLSSSNDDSKEGVDQGWQGPSESESRVFMVNAFIAFIIAVFSSEWLIFVISALFLAYALSGNNDSS